MESTAFTSSFVSVNRVRLHCLDWGGSGPVLLFLSGMGCSVHIFGELAPHFTDRYHVLALDRRGHGDSDYPENGYDAATLTEDLRQFLDARQVDRVILVGHSLAYIELCHFAALYPKRVHKLVFLDAAYDSTSAESKAVMAQNPLPKMHPGWPQDDVHSYEEYAAIVRSNNPSIAQIWTEAFDQQTRHTLRFNPDGTVGDKMTPGISTALTDTIAAYVPEFPALGMPILSIFADLDGSDFLSSEYMTLEQQAQVKEYFTNVRQPYNQWYVEKFQHTVPHARIVRIPHGHHYCFIKHRAVVLEAMRSFLQGDDGD